MTTEILIWILTGVFICVAAGLSAYIKLEVGIGGVRERVVKLETIIELLGRKSATLLHSPHDPYGLDPMLDKYLDRHYEMSMEEWASLMRRCEVVADDVAAPAEYRFLAAQLMAVCWHKQMMPPPARRHIERLANDAEDQNKQPKQ